MDLLSDRFVGWINRSILTHSEPNRRTEEIHRRGTNGTEGAIQDRKIGKWRADGKVEEILQKLINRFTRLQVPRGGLDLAREWELYPFYDGNLRPSPYK